ncbi:hypothetical protein COMA1_10547 [Candidatus Nitrospira nitrosa]|uniref:Uncharacterized protein n=1 Tax=Candidatus Nitrospira nitrosa TaxID=1742972 RepID=A0A0S4L6E6_9BACT|nr:hypothetical protein COMA1_10547 [Candidatus Nitrospira nitrosa]
METQLVPIFLLGLVFDQISSIARRQTGIILLWVPRILIRGQGVRSPINSRKELE